MPLIELPRALEDYFAFAEMDPTRKGRRFVISLPYFDGTRLDRLQWWYHVSTAQERMIGAAGIVALRTKEVERFHRHIERWLQNTGKRLHGSEPIPQVSALEAAASAPTIEETQPAPSAWPREKVANG